MTKPRNSALLLALALVLAFSGCDAARKARQTGTDIKDKAAKSVSGQAHADTIKIGAIFSVTGSASYLGEPEKKTAEMLEEQINAAGGVLGKKLDIIVYDDEGDEAKTQELAKKLLFEDQVLAVIGPSRSGNTMAIKDLMTQNKTVLISCAAAEAIVDPLSPWVFKVYQKDSFVARHILQHLKDSGITRIAMLYGNTGFGQEGFRQMKAFAPEFGVTIGYDAHYEPSATEGDFETLLTKVKADRSLQAVVNWSILPAQSIVPSKMKQLGLNLPLYHSHGFGNIQYARNAGGAAEGVIFPAGRLIVAYDLPDDHPQKNVLVNYRRAYEERFKEDISTFGGHAYDAIYILVNALEKAGVSDDKEALRKAVESVEFMGTGGMYRYSPEDHNGLGMDSLDLLTIRNGEFGLLNQ
jgi:branched-chain amino acid transport system substrate-binding protein